jgi:hypothetical protein
VELIGNAGARVNARMLRTVRSAKRAAVLTDVGTFAVAPAQFERVEAWLRPPTALCSIWASRRMLTPRIFATCWRLKPWGSPMPVRRISTSVCRGASDERQPFSGVTRRRRVLVENGPRCWRAARDAAATLPASPLASSDDGPPSYESEVPAARAALAPLAPLAPPPPPAGWAVPPDLAVTGAPAVEEDLDGEGTAGRCVDGGCTVGT